MDDAELREQIEGLASAASVFGEDNPRTTRRIDALLQLIKARDAAKGREVRIDELRHVYDGEAIYFYEDSEEASTVGKRIMELRREYDKAKPSLD